MKSSEIDHIISTTFGEITRLRDLKGGEYAEIDDALANFKRNGRDCGLDPIAVWRVYAGKHWDAISTYVKDINAGVVRVRTESIEGRIDDLITYLILFKGLLQEREQLAQRTPVHGTV